MNIKFCIAFLVGVSMTFSGCFAHQDTSSTNQQQEVAKESMVAQEKTKSIKLTIGDTIVPVTWESNPSVANLQKYLPLTIQMSQYGGFEQVGFVGQDIVRDDREITTQCGDIVLYSGNKIVIFYGSNSWAYTKLGHINLSQKEMKDLLSSGDVEITLYEE